MSSSSKSKGLPAILKITIPAELVWAFRWFNMIWEAEMIPEESDAEKQVTLKLIKEFRGNLNKITPEKYDKILDKIKALQIDTEVRLR